MLQNNLIEKIYFGGNIIIINNFVSIFVNPKHIKMELRLKEILAQRHITLKDFAASSGISQSNLSNYLNGNISPTLDTLNRIAENLGIEVTELFKENDDVELYAKHNGILYPITKSDIIDIISNKAK